MMSLKPNEYIPNSTRVYMVEKNNFNAKYGIPWVSLLARKLKHRLSPSLLLSKNESISICKSYTAYKRQTNKQVNKIAINI